MTYEEFAKNGYLIDKNDFKNFEGTIYWRRIGDWIDEKKMMIIENVRDAKTPIK